MTLTSTTETRRARLIDLLTELKKDLRAGSVPSLRAEDLARASGVSVRTAYRAASRHLGAPPVTRLRRSRLEGVRSRMLAATPGETVTAAAADWGFTHLGRFAALYQREFGESPSDTLRRGRSAGLPRPESAPRSSHHGLQAAASPS